MMAIYNVRSAVTKNRKLRRNICHSLLSFLSLTKEVLMPKTVAGIRSWSIPRIGGTTDRLQGLIKFIIFILPN
jgi:hypothetical protein